MPDREIDVLDPLQPERDRALGKQERHDRLRFFERVGHLVQHILRTHRSRRHDDHQARTGAQGAFDGFIPPRAGRDVELVDPYAHAILPQGFGHVEHESPIGTSVTEEDCRGFSRHAVSPFMALRPPCCKSVGGRIRSHLGPLAHTAFVTPQRDAQKLGAMRVLTAVTYPISPTAAAGLECFAAIV